jgi:photosystem II stability/assembly factor-like uncharacterized protein
MNPTFTTFKTASCFAIFFVLSFSCQQHENPGSALHFPEPTEIFHAQEEGGESGNARERWEKMSHLAAPGVDWQEMDAQTRLRLAEERRLDYAGVSSRSVESFANGQLTGSWAERGSQNQAGSLRIVDYDKDLNKIYGISDGGTLWQGNLDGTGWSALNDDLRFDGRILKVIPDGAGGKRILCAIGKQIWYSDNSGVSFTQATGLSYYDNWGFPVQLIALNDASNTLYFLVFTWDSVPWNSRMWLFQSTNRGQSWTKIHTFAHSANYWDARKFTKIWSPFNTSEAYALHLGTTPGVYSISGSTVTLLNANTVLPNNSAVDLEGNKTGSTLTMYALAGSNTLYKSTDNGASWTLQSTLPKNAWDVGIYVSPFNANRVFMGEVECYRSYDAGVNWTKVNTWQSYYSNTNKLHADIMDIRGFEKTDGTKFLLVGNHGGLHVSYDDLTSTTNICNTGLNISQYYDVRTDPNNSNYIYAGSQDQGHQRTSLGGSGGSVNFTQVISGDYGHMAFTNNGNRLWTVYPGGWVTYYNSPQTSGYNSSYDVGGTDKPVGGWIYPTSETAVASANQIFIAGGNISGGTGSYLVKLTAPTSSPYTITATQFNFDFKSSSGSTISAVEASTLNANRIYVATANGKFYQTNDGGTNWQLAINFTGPPEYYLYGSCILASKINPDLVWFAGSGYSNPPMYKSTDGGQTFTAISTGLPSTLVQEIVANDSESLLFAATEVGPYVYVVSQNQWYPMLGNATPMQRYYSVEYVSSNSTVRFGTYGRGIWDFSIASQPPALPVDWLAFDARATDDNRVQLAWATASEFNNNRFEVERSADGIEFQRIGQVPAKGTSNYQANYAHTDALPLPGNSYYRIRQVDFDGKFSFSKIKSVSLPEKVASFRCYPNPAPAGKFALEWNFEASEPAVVTVWNSTGGKLLEQKITRPEGREWLQLPPGTQGVVLVEIATSRQRQVLKLLTAR